MNYLNLTISNLTSETFLDATPTQRATWLCLMRYCAQQETGGIVPGAAGWGDRKWMQVCAVTKAEVREDCKLWQWDGDNIVVEFYPVNQEGAAARMREAGKRYGKGKAIKPIESPPFTSNNSPPNSPPFSQAKDKDKGKDKDKDKDNTDTPQPPKGGVSRFKPPSVGDVGEYCRERSNSVDPEKFVDHYTANGWKVGKNPMKDWKAAVRTWERNNLNSGGNSGQSQPVHPSEDYEKIYADENLPWIRSDGNTEKSEPMSDEERDAIIAKGQIPF